jgi:hypothetical protein
MVVPYTVTCRLLSGNLIYFDAISTRYQFHNAKVTVSLLEQRFYVDLFDEPFRDTLTSWLHSAWASAITTLHPLPLLGDQLSLCNEQDNKILRSRYIGTYFRTTRLPIDRNLVILLRRNVTAAWICHWLAPRLKMFDLLSSVELHGPAVGHSDQSLMSEIPSKHAPFFSFCFFFSWSWN